MVGILFYKSIFLQYLPVQDNLTKWKRKYWNSKLWGMCACVCIGSPMVCDLIWFTSNELCVFYPQALKTQNELDVNHIKSQTMGNYFYHIFATLYLPFVWTIMSHNFSFVNKLHKIHICLWGYKQKRVVRGAKWRFWHCVWHRNTQCNNQNWCNKWYPLD